MTGPGLVATTQGSASGDLPMTLESVIVARGLIGPEALSRARRVVAETGELLASVVTRLGLVSEQGLAGAVSAATGWPIAGERDFAEIPPPAAAPISVRFLRDIKAAPMGLAGPMVAVAFVDPLETYARQALAVAFGRPVRPFVGTASDVEAALERHYGPARPADALGGDDLDADDMERLKDLASDAPAIRAVNRLISGAVEARASDIHLEPTDSALKLRLRIDGVMHDLEPLPASMRASVVSRIKVMSGLNIAERRLPQDGRARLAVRGQDVDIRVATSPTIHGESAVMRLLDRSQVSLDFDALGFDAHVLGRLRPLLAQPHGIMLVTGPTGSGKTTTLYAALSELNAPERKLLTIEDPVEYRLPGVAQTQVAPGIGLTFAAALRSFLRQDPDVMMVGEIRDLETAQVAVQAALTGHMVLSTLHTNSAAAAVTRLIDMGVEPFLIISTLNAVLAQRLVRRLCVECREQVSTDGVDLGLGEAGGGLRRFWRACGCRRCDGSGYRGRVAVSELLVMDEALSRLVLERAGAQEIEGLAIASGMRTLLIDGVSKIGAGVTTVEEVMRVTGEA